MLADEANGGSDTENPEARLVMVREATETRLWEEELPPSPEQLAAPGCAAATAR